MKGLPVDLCGVARRDEVFLVNVRADGCLPLVAAVAELHDLHRGFADGEDRAFDDELIADGAGALAENGLERVVVPEDDRDHRRHGHAGKVDHDRLAAPRLADQPARVADHRKPRNPRRRKPFALAAVIVGTEKLDGGTDREIAHALAPCVGSGTTI